MARLHRDKQQDHIMRRAEKVRSYRLAGFTYRQIADRMDIGVGTVKADLERLAVEFPQQTTRQIVAEQNDKLVEMMKPQYLKAIGGDARAATVMLKLLDHQAKLWNAYGIGMEGESSQALDMLATFFGQIRPEGGASGQDQ